MNGTYDRGFGRVGFVCLLGRHAYLKAFKTQILVFKLIFFKCCRILLFSSLRVLSRTRLDW